MAVVVIQKAAGGCWRAGRHAEKDAGLVESELSGPAEHWARDSSSLVLAAASDRGSRPRSSVTSFRLPDPVRLIYCVDFRVWPKLISALLKYPMLPAENWNA